MHIPVLKTFPSQELQTEAAKYAANLLRKKIAQNSAVTIFLSGGSAIAMYKELFQSLTQNDSSTLGKVIQIALVDERYGNYGHSDSNEQQLRERGVIEVASKQGIQFAGILHLGNPNPQTALALATKTYQQLFSENSYKILLLGLGEDGHTAGWLPTQSEEHFHELYDSQKPLVYYEVDPTDSSNPYIKRLTISTSVLTKINQIIMYVKGENKKPALNHFLNQDTALHQTPALILRQSNVPITLLSDQLPS